LPHTAFVAIHFTCIPVNLVEERLNTTTVLPYKHTPASLLRRPGWQSATRKSTAARPAPTLGTMVARTRSQTAGAQRCRGTGGCHTRSSTGRLQCVTQCRWRCSVAECRNTAVCTSPPLVGAKRGDFCEPCTALLACAPVLRAETGECGVCLEVKQLYVLPMCKIHKTCAGCSRRILYGTDRKSVV